MKDNYEVRERTLNMGVTGGDNRRKKDKYWLQVFFHMRTATKRVKETIKRGGGGTRGSRGEHE